MVAALTLDGISKRYGGFQAVSDLSFQVEKGSICGFLGPNGAGKTSTLRMILGLQPATSGRIDILGADDGRKVRDRIGFLPEERGLYKKMTPVDAIAFFGGLKGLPLPEGRRRGREMLEQMGLGEASKKKMKELSKGMAQKVQLIASVVHQPEFVILDEPFSGLDPMNQQGLEAMIRALADNGATVLFSTHVMQHAERLCDKVVLLARGRKAFEGTVDEARAIAEGEGASELCIIGGGEIFRQLLDQASDLYLTWVDAEVPADTHFPEVDVQDWREVSSEPHPADDRHAYAFRFVHYVRR